MNPLICGIYTLNGILPSHEKKWNTDTCYNMDEPQKHYAKRKKPHKNYILYYSISNRYPE